jgi:protein phosphatase
MATVAIRGETRMLSEPYPRAAGSVWSPTSGMTFDVGAATDVGPVRRLNEDSYLVAPPVFLVADGMGGHGGGDLASRLVTEVFRELAEDLVDAQAVGLAVTRAAARVGGMERTTDGRAPGTTFAAVCYVEESGTPYWCITSMGDSRVYLLGDGLLSRLTRDHSVVQELIDEGTISPDEASSHPERHVVTRALGADLSTPADFSLVPIEPGTRILICSDGVWGTLSDPELTELMTVSTPAEAVERLLAAAFAAGGRDNATAVLVEVSPASQAGGDPQIDDTVEVVAAAGLRTRA